MYVLSFVFVEVAVDYVGHEQDSVGQCSNDATPVSEVVHELPRMEDTFAAHLCKKVSYGSDCDVSSVFDELSKSDLRLRAWA